jgi:5-methylcytosine-specific restriction endonuclease McrA
MGMFDIDIYDPFGNSKSTKTKRKKFNRTVEKAIFQKYNGVCAICGKKTAFDYGEIDHIKALAKGGSNSEGNLQWLCHRCNKLKGSKKIASIIRLCLIKVSIRNYMIYM